MPSLIMLSEEDSTLERKEGWSIHTLSTPLSWKRRRHCEYMALQGEDEGEDEEDMYALSLPHQRVEIANGGSG
jgi:hypothetical protein